MNTTRKPRAKPAPTSVKTTHTRSSGDPIEYEYERERKRNATDDPLPAPVEDDEPKIPEKPIRWLKFCLVDKEGTIRCRHGGRTFMIYQFDLGLHDEQIAMFAEKMEKAALAMRNFLKSK